jgi:site-specific DNA-methyltransferase (adenine-specific)
VVTDPPYGIKAKVGRSNDPHRGLARVRKGRRAFPDVFGDDRPFDPAHLLALGLPTVLFGGNHFSEALPSSPSWIVWDKRRNGQEGQFDQADAELAWTNLGGPIRTYRQPWTGSDRPVEDWTSAAIKVEHPTQKPLSLMRWIIGRCPDGTVLDPYMGSGSTLMAAKSLGRVAIGIEIDEGYCERAAIRCSQEVLGLVG